MFLHVLCSFPHARATGDSGQPGTPDLFSNLEPWPSPPRFLLRQSAAQHLGEHDGVVTIFRGVKADVPGLDMSHAYETSTVRIDQLNAFNARSVQQGIGASSLDDAERTVQRLALNQKPAQASTGGG
jgi:hypothetical protein